MLTQLRFDLKPTEEMSAQLTISKLNIAAKDHSLFQLSMDGRDKVLMAEEVANTDWLLVMVMDKGVLEQPLNDMLMVQIGIGLGILLVMALLTSWFVARQLNELGNIANALADIAEGDGDLTRRLDVRSQDEVGLLADKFNKFVDCLHQMVKMCVKCRWR